MAVKKNIALMSVTTGSRLVVGLFTFSVVARLLGPESFGILMLWMSVAGLLALLVNYGLTSYVLREIGASPKSAEQLINEGYTAKLILAFGLLAITLVSTYVFALDRKLALMCLLIATISDTFIEFFSAAFRARNKFAVETRIATATSLTHAVIVTGIVFWFPTVEMAALAYALSRLLVLAVTSVYVTAVFAPLRVVPIVLALRRLRSAVTYAIDFGFQSLFGQIDSVVLNHFLGPTSVGLYQAGMRVFQGGVAAAQVLANVFLPRAAGFSSDKNAFARESTRIQIAFLAVGIVFGLGLAIMAKPLVTILFGVAYKDLIKVLPMFGLLFYLRFLAGAWGVVLTASGQQTYRMWAGMFHWVVIAIATWVSLPDLGMSGWLLSLCIGNIFLALAYALRVQDQGVRVWQMLVPALAGSILFFPFLDIR